MQYDHLTDQHRGLRDNHSAVHEEAEKLRLDVKHLNDCVSVLRNELQAARDDRAEAVRLQQQVHSELDESRTVRKQLSEKGDQDAKVILDLRRQCKEMERILMRKHPDSVSALIVASKSSVASGSGAANQEGRKLLEQRIQQLERDAKEQDAKAQKILANVQDKFSSVQAKYETHIADLETQVLSLQDINTKLNQKVVALTETMAKRETEYQDLSAAAMMCDETVDLSRRPSTSERATQTIATPLNAMRLSSSGNVTKKAVIPKAANGAENDSHLVATIRGMRVDLAIKEKALQRLNRELDECKKTIKKLKEGRI